MTARDRLILIVIAVVAILGAGWMLGVKPAQEQASKVSGEVSAARSQLQTVQGEVATARTAEQHYRAAYASLATLGIAVPTSGEVPALIYTIDQASSRKKIEFSSINNGSGGSGSGGASGPGAQAAGFRQMPLTFTFAGSYKDLIDFLKQLEGFTVQSPTGTLQVSGRLLTIQSISFSAPAVASSSSPSSNSQSSNGRPGEMSWSISATAYVLPPAPTPAPPAGASAAPQPASAGGSSGSAAGTPAVVRATP